jgi:hypothetical protein
MNWKTVVVSITCLLGAGAGGFFLYQDLHEQAGLGNGTPVGKVERRESQVRRKSSNSYVWNHVQSSESLYKKDSIQTGKGSAVSIRLNDGSVLDIGENSLVVMDDVANIALNFIRGSIVVHKADGDSKISVGKDGKQKVEELSARLIKPEPLARYFVNPKDLKSVVFQWELRSKTQHDTVTVQVSKDKRFIPQSTRTLAVPAQAPFVKESLAPGDYYWRVLSKGVPLTETRGFKVLSVAPLSPIWPAQAQKVIAQGEETSQFRWLVQKSSHAEEVDVTLGEHRIEVGRDPDFKSSVVNEAINPVTGRYSASHLSDGTFYWRIRSKYSDFVVLSPSKMFEFKRVVKPPDLPPKKEPLLPAPVWAKPAFGSTWNLLEEATLSEASWEEVPGADSYEITVYLDAKASNERKLILKEATDKTKISLKSLKPGDYQWSVRALDKKKRPGDAIPLRKLSVTLGKLLGPPQVISPEVQ